MAAVPAPAGGATPLARRARTLVDRKDGVLEDHNWPRCNACKAGVLVPLSDFGGQGAPIHYKAWVCTNPPCGFNIKIRNGEVHFNEPIITGANPRGPRN